MPYLHNYDATCNPTDCLFGVKFVNEFFADDGFGNFITYGKDSLHQLFASTTDILRITCEERDEAPLPKLID